MGETSTDERRPPLRVSLLTSVPVFFAAIVVLYFLFGSHLGPRHPARLERNRCLANLRQLGRALVAYAEDNRGTYPPPARWCDAIVARHGGDEQFIHYFRCRWAEVGPCNYAMNPYAEPNSAEDVVLLFETTPGWNQYGGADLLTMENHEGQGASVLVVDGTVKFVKAEDVNGLNWGDEVTSGVQTRDGRQRQHDEESDE